MGGANFFEKGLACFIYPIPHVNHGAVTFLVIAKNLWFTVSVSISAGIFKCLLYSRQCALFLSVITPVKKRRPFL